MIEFKLPSLGAEMDEGTLLEWKVQPGDAVKKGDIVALVDTSKAAIDVEIWQEGTIHALLLAVNDKVPVGTTIAYLREPGESAEQVEAALQRLAPQVAGATAQRPAGAPAAAIPAVGAPAAGLPAAGVSPAALPPSAAAPTPPGARRPPVSPAARKRARELGIDVDAVIGTGPQGAVTLHDVESATIAPAVPKDRATEMRAAIAAAMARSKREIPHYYLATDIALDAATRWLAERNAGRDVTERMLMAVLLLKAVALALRKYPELNGHFRDGAFVPGAGIHLGVAISLRQGGLIAPAIRDVDALPLAELMRRLADLVARARAFSLRSSEMSDATITVTNLGDQGSDVVQGVIYPPQVALVGFGKVSERPWAEGGQVVVKPVVTASLSADHRASDGHRGALFLAEVARLLQDPAGLDGSGSR